MSDFRKLLLGQMPVRPDTGLLLGSPFAHMFGDKLSGKAGLGTGGQGTPDTHYVSLRGDDTIKGLLENSPDIFARAKALTGWFVGDSEQAVEARGHYKAREVVSSLAFMAFHDAKTPEEKKERAAFFVESAKGFLETLQILRKQGNLDDLSKGLFGLSRNTGYFLRDLETSGLPPEEIQKIQEELKKTLRQSYLDTAAAIPPSKVEWRAMKEWASARAESLNPPKADAPPKDYFQWLRKMNASLKEAQKFLTETTPNKNELAALIESDLSSFGNLPSDALLAREFISRTTSSFVTLIASEIDLKDGDSEETVNARYQTLQLQVEKAFNDSPDPISFAEALAKVDSKEAKHLKGLISDSAVLLELTTADRELLKIHNNPNYHLSEVVKIWGNQVLTILENHSLNVLENALAKNEQHLGATKAILEYFQGGPLKASALRKNLMDFAGTAPADEDKLNERATKQWNHIHSFGFGVMNGASHFFSIKTLPFVVGAGVLSRATQWALLAKAGSSGSLAVRGLALVEEGALTKTGSFMAGTLTGAGLSLGFSGYQLASDLKAGRPEAWGNFGKNFGLGLVVNTVALGGSAALTRGLRLKSAAPYELEMALKGETVGGTSRMGHFFRRTLPYSLAHAGVGTAGMIGTNALFRGIHNWGLPDDKKAPLLTTDEFVETYLTMLAMNGFEGALDQAVMRRPSLLERQLGPYRSQKVQEITHRVMETYQLHPDSSPYADRITDAQSAAYRTEISKTVARMAIQGLPMRTLESDAFKGFIASRLKLPRLPAGGPTPGAAAPAAGAGAPPGAGAPSGAAASWTLKRVEILPAGSGGPQEPGLLLHTVDGNAYQVGKRLTGRMMGGVELQPNITAGSTYLKVEQIQDVPGTQPPQQVITIKIINLGQPEHTDRFKIPADVAAAKGLRPASWHSLNHSGGPRAPGGAGAPDRPTPVAGATPVAPPTAAAPRAPAITPPGPLQYTAGELIAMFEQGAVVVKMSDTQYMLFPPTPQGVARPTLAGKVVDAPAHEQFLVWQAQRAGAVDSTGQFRIGFEPRLPRDGNGRFIVPEIASLPLKLGPEALYQQVDLGGIAAASHQGRGYVDDAGAPKNNEDRFVVVVFPNGRTVKVSVDGMGGHKGGERSAEIGARLIEKAVRGGESLEDAIDLADQGITKDNREFVFPNRVAEWEASGVPKARAEALAKQGLPGAVAAGIEISPQGDGTYVGRFASVGDSEAVVFRFPQGMSSFPEVAFWTARPTPRQRATAQGTRDRGQTLMGHLDPMAHIVDQALGGHHAGTPTIHSLRAALKASDVVLTGSDGFWENYSSFDEIGRIITQSGQTSAAGIRDVLLTDCLIRMRLVEMMMQEGKAIELTGDRYKQAYQDVTGQPAPGNWHGAYEGFWVDPNGHVGPAGEIDPSTGQLKVDPSTGIPLKAVAHFKPDNVTMTYKIVGAPIQGVNPTPRPSSAGTTPLPVDKTPPAGTPAPPPGPEASAETDPMGDRPTEFFKRTGTGTPEPDVGATQSGETIYVQAAKALRAEVIDNLPKKYSPNRRYVVVEVLNENGIAKLGEFKISASPACEEGRLVLEWTQSDSGENQLRLVEHGLGNYPPEIQQAILGSSGGGIDPLFAPVSEKSPASGEGKKPKLELVPEDEFDDAAETQVIDTNDALIQVGIQDALKAYVDVIRGKQPATPGTVKVYETIQGGQHLLSFSWRPSSGPTVAEPPPGTHKLVATVEILGNILADPTQFQIRGALQTHPELLAKIQKALVRMIKSYQSPSAEISDLNRPPEGTNEEGEDPTRVITEEERRQVRILTRLEVVMGQYFENPAEGTLVVFKAPTRQNLLMKWIPGKEIRLPKGSQVLMTIRVLGNLTEKPDFYTFNTIKDFTPEYRAAFEGAWKKLIEMHQQKK